YQSSRCSTAPLQPPKPPTDESKSWSWSYPALYRPGPLLTQIPRSSRVFGEEGEDLRLMRSDDGAVIASGHLDVLVILHRDRLHRLGPRASHCHRHDRIHVPVHEHDRHL